MHDLVARDSQFIIATHSPIIMAYPDAQIYHCGNDGLRKVAYEDTEHFRVTRDFLVNRQRMLDILLTTEQSQPGENRHGSRMA